MDDDRKKPFRGKPQRSGGASRPASGGDGGKRFGKDTKPRFDKKAGPADGGRGGDKPRPARRDFAEPREPRAAEGARPFGKSGPRREQASASAGDRKPFVKRDRSDGPPSGDRKPFVKRDRSDAPSGGGDRDAAGRPKYWGKRPGKAERQEIARGPGETGGERPARADSPKQFNRDFDRPKPAYGDGPKRSFGDRPKPAFGDGPKRSFGDRPKPAFGDGPKRSFGDRPKPAFGDGPKRSSGDRPKPAFGDGPKRSFDDRPKPAFGDGPKRSFGDRPKPAFGDGPKRSFGSKPATGERSERKPFARREGEAAEEGERIAKRLARAGISSRRDAESLIALGRVRVNGVVLSSPAHNVMTDDRIEVDGNEIPAIERTRLFLFHKPAGVVTTNRDPEGRKTVFDVLPEGLPRLLTVGRLDINTEGLLLLTNDGGLSRMLELPSTGWLRRYRVRVHGKVDEQRLASLKDGIAVEGVFYGSIEASLEREQGSNAWLSIGLREGKNREVRNILGALDLEVNRLIRISYGPFQLGELAEGEVLEIKGRTLRDQLGERLVEESGANFEADIAKPFSNRPVRRNDREARAEAPPVERKPRELKIGEGGLVKGGFRRDRERNREDVLGRLSTRPEGKPFKREEGRGGPAGGKSFGAGKPRGKRDDRDDQPMEPPGGRRANVWMAPGARPQGKRPSERAADKKREGKAEGGKFAKAGPGRPGRPPAGRSDGPRSPRSEGRPGAPRSPGKPPRR